MDDYIGVIRQWAGYRCPRNFMFCEGQTISIKNHEPLYSIIGTTYGGDGITSFKLPDLRPSTNTDVYKLNNPVVYRSHETGDPGTIGHMADSSVVFDHTVENPRIGWSDNPKFMICVYGLYPSFD